MMKKQNNINPIYNYISMVVWYGGMTYTVLAMILIYRLI